MAEHIGNVLQENGENNNKELLKLNDEEELDKIINSLESGEEDIDDLIKAL